MKKKKKNRLFETYSKIIETIFLLVYLLGVATGIYAVIVEPSTVEFLLIYIGASATVSTGFYFWKAKAENMVKLTQQYPDVYDDIVKKKDNDEVEEE